MSNSRMQFLDTRGSYWDEEGEDVESYVHDNYEEVVSGLYVDDGKFFTINIWGSEFDTSINEWKDYQNFLESYELINFIRKIKKGK